MAKCKYISESYPYYQCDQEALADSKEGFCIFHERRKDKDIEKFKAGIKDKMEKKDYDFTGYYFPTASDFTHQIFEDRISFSEAQFHDLALFEKAEFQGWASFAEAKFQGGAVFDGAKFQDEVLFYRAAFQRDAGFNQVQFRGRASFVGAEFRARASFEGAKFQDWTFFDRVQLQGAALFATAEFLRPVSFRDTYFAFAVDADIAYRYAKDAWRSEGDYDEAGHYYLLRARARRRQRNPIARGLEFIFLDLTCGYGEQPWKVVLTALALVFGCAFLYYFFFPITSADIQITGVGWGYFKDCLYFSCVTFTTLGYGDLRPMLEVGTRAVASIEAFSGGFIMALFALCLGKKLMR